MSSNMKILSDHNSQELTCPNQACLELEVVGLKEEANCDVGTAHQTPVQLQLQTLAAPVQCGGHYAYCSQSCNFQWHSHTIYTPSNPSELASINNKGIVQ